MLGRLRHYLYDLTQDMDRLAAIRYKEFKVCKSTVEPYIGELKGKVILDIGCGRYYPYTILLNSLGNTVIGIDTDYIGIRGTLLAGEYWQELTRNGPKAAVKAFLYDYLLRKRTHYYRALQRVCEFPLKLQGITIKRMDAENMAFPDGLFDLVVSSFTFEHIANVPKAVSELSRVLKSGGIAFIKIGLFSSRLGGHHLYKELAKVPPWDHLRQNKYPVPAYLNRVRESEYVALFSEKFKVAQILREIDEEGRKLLTPEVQAELSDYSEEELLTTALNLVARKPDGKQ